MNLSNSSLYLLKRTTTMRYLLLSLIFISTFSIHAQDSTAVENNSPVTSSDTVDIYVLSKNSRFVELKGEGKSRYAFYYRDLKFIKELRELIFEDADDAIKFFNICQKALDTDKTYITHGYNVMRNRASKNVLRLQNKDGGYTMIRRDTFDDMRAAFTRSLE